jgi:hypothetical protein
MYFAIISASPAEIMELNHRKARIFAARHAENMTLSNASAGEKLGDRDLPDAPRGAIARAIVGVESVTHSVSLAMETGVHADAAAEFNDVPQVRFGHILGRLPMVDPGVDPYIDFAPSKIGQILCQARITVCSKKQCAAANNSCACTRAVLASFARSFSATRREKRKR